MEGVEGDGFDGGAGALALHDAPARVPIGQLLTGCVRGASIIGKAFDEETLRKAFGADRCGNQPPRRRAGVASMAWRLT